MKTLDQKIEQILEDVKGRKRKPLKAIIDMDKVLKVCEGSSQRRVKL